MNDESYTVSDVARLAHVSVRTLHHYDDIGLLTPARRTPAGYRMYEAADLERLRDILLYRELGFTLEAIQLLLAQPPEERLPALRAQRRQLEDRLRRTELVIRAVDTALAAMERGTIMDTRKMFEGFEEFEHAKYAAEAEERWGSTEAYRESARRTRGYTKQDWATIRTEGDDIVSDWAALRAAGHEPEDPEVQAVVERHRAHIDRWFYPCDRTMHACLGDMYVADPRFADFYNRRQAGLAEFVAASIRVAQAG